MDADIAAATTAFELDKIKAQDYRAALISQKADREAHRLLLAALFEWSKNEYATLPPVEDHVLQYRKRMALSIAANYMKPTSGTLDETIAADAQMDAKRLKAAVDAATQV